MRKVGDIYKYQVESSSGCLPTGEHWKGWIYEIYRQCDNALVRESNEWFDSEAQAGFASVGHISLLENGEG